MHTAVRIPFLPRSVGHPPGAPHEYSDSSPAGPGSRRARESDREKHDEHWPDLPRRNRREPPFRFVVSGAVLVAATDRGGRRDGREAYEAVG